MGWETRRGRGSYYYHSKRVDGRVVKEYCGRGELAALVARLDDLNRDERKTARLQEQAEEAMMREMEASIAPLDLAADLAMRTAMQEAGYHRHSRGSWRKKRGKHTSIDEEGAGTRGGRGEGC